MGLIFRYGGFVLLAYSLIMLLAYKANSHVIEVAVSGVAGGIALAISFLFDNDTTPPTAH